jgi:hypothetical protein
VGSFLILEKRNTGQHLAVQTGDCKVPGMILLLHLKGAMQLHCSKEIALHAST